MRTRRSTCYANVPTCTDFNRAPTCRAVLRTNFFLGHPPGHQTKKFGCPKYILWEISVAQTDFRSCGDRASASLIRNNLVTSKFNATVDHLAELHLHNHSIQQNSHIHLSQCKNHRSLNIH